MTGCTVAGQRRGAEDRVGCRPPSYFGLYPVSCLISRLSKTTWDRRGRCYSGSVPRVRRPYCPGCRPHADTIRELVVLRWYEAHAPTLDGPDDTVAASTPEPVWSDEVTGWDNRRWCELFHGTARSEDADRGDHTPDAPVRLFVIRRGEAETVAWFRARYGERPDTAVIWDRRIGEWRTRVRHIRIERREHERRSSRDAASETFGFVLATAGA
jgi:hypothetical protein